MKFLMVMTTASILIATPVLACLGDYDCEAGAQCIKSGMAYSGVCVGGYTSGKPKDREEDLDLPYRYKSTFDKKGESCYGDYDCGTGGECLKSGHSYQGTCTK